LWVMPKHDLASTVDTEKCFSAWRRKRGGLLPSTLRAQNLPFPSFLLPFLLLSAVNNQISTSIARNPGHLDDLVLPRRIISLCVCCLCVCHFFFMLASRLPFSDLDAIPATPPKIRLRYMPIVRVHSFVCFSLFCSEMFKLHSCSCPFDFKIKDPHLGIGCFA
jgi:hypothetical protein